MPDPNLESLRTELVALFKKHDVSGIVVASSRTHSIYSLNLSPSWSCLELGNNSIRFNTLKFPEAQRKQVSNDTVSLVMGSADAITALQEQIRMIQINLGQHFQISHVSRTEPPHR